MLLFISDLHLDASRPQVTQAFFHFLQQKVTPSDTLYILGDLFELWVGDDDDDPFVLSVQQEIKSLSEKGTPIYFMHGNRDFLIGERFAQQSGCQLLDEPTVMTVANETVLLIHGDSLCTKDQAYQAFRQESRSLTWRNMVMVKSLAERRQIGQQLRQQSKTMSSRKAEDIMDVDQDTVVTTMQTFQASKLIHGHTHRPKRHSFTIADKPVERVVLGDWDNKAWCLRFDGDWHLDAWAIPT